ncbi:spondin domain-containing protein [Thalassotalea agarivorans]|uniref:Spondin_N n=1 Tax=Thalassotalea agarivorans TaxID=349064 RepID=A0A1I0AJG2_THASX|nr:spondin domain-containing protein [Thalassotalea agarivorans]SES93970.1 Spondin_N [Thalassotalea agarivorans]
MKKTTLIAGFVTAALTSTAGAAELDVTISNLTQGIHFTPLVVAAHDDSGKMFASGEMASPELQAIAEGGSIDGMVTLLGTINADVAANPAGGLLAPGASTMTSMSTADSNMYLSIAAMILPTNDGFVGVNSWKIPTEPGTYTFTMNAYDAGTEVNDEIINGGGASGTPGIPVAPGGDGGTGGTGVATTETNSYVHIHRGNLGDDNATGGKSDLDSSIHRWLNPVARVTVVVK